MKVLFALLILFNLAHAKDKDPVVASVNGKNILLSEVREYYKNSLLTVSNKIVTIESSLNEIINRELGIMKAKKSKLQNEPAIENKLNDVLFHAQTSKDLEGKLKSIGASVSDNDVKKYYKKNKEYETSHILFRLRALPTPEEVKTAYDQTIQIVNELKTKPENFVSIAKKYSQSTASSTGGNMGYRPPVGYVPLYFAAIRGKKVGQIIGPVRTQYGVHVIKITGIKKFSDINMKVYKKILYDIKRDKIIANYFEDMRNGASVKINKQYLK